MKSRPKKWKLISSKFNGPDADDKIEELNVIIRRYLDKHSLGKEKGIFTRKFYVTVWDLKMECRLPSHIVASVKWNASLSRRQLLIGTGFPDCSWFLCDSELSGLFPHVFRLHNISWANVPTKRQKRFIANLVLGMPNPDKKWL